MNNWGMWWGEFQGRHGFRLRRPLILETDWSHAHPSFGQANRLLNETSTLPAQNQGQNGLRDDFPLLFDAADPARHAIIVFDSIPVPTSRAHPSPLQGMNESHRIRTAFLSSLRLSQESTI